LDIDTKIISNDSEIYCQSRLSQSEEFLAAKGDKQARDKIIRANIPLVGVIASRYYGLGLDKCDLIQEGCIGLIQAAKKFDPRLGNRFSNYATWWIHQKIISAIHEQGSLIRLPKREYQRINELLEAQSRLEILFCRIPSDEEIALEIGMLTSDETLIAWYCLSTNQLILAVQVRQKLRRAATFVQRLKTIIKGVLPFVLEIPDDLAKQFGLLDDTCFTQTYLEDIIADMNQNELFDLHSELMEQIQHLLEGLPPRERKVIELRFGLVDGKGFSQEELGHEFGVTQERIRQIEEKALRKLRNPSRLRKLKDWVSLLYDSKEDKKAKEMAIEKQAEQAHLQNLEKISKFRKELREWLQLPVEIRHSQVIASLRNIKATEHDFQIPSLMLAGFLDEQTDQAFDRRLSYWTSHVDKTARNLSSRLKYFV
jgi:RNA polymerase sigma factor (sigma-70 family)